MSGLYFTDQSSGTVERTQGKVNVYNQSTNQPIRLRHPYLQQNMQYVTDYVQTFLTIDLFAGGINMHMYSTKHYISIHLYP